MLDRLEAALSSLGETIEAGIDPKQDLLAYTQTVGAAANAAGAAAATPSTRPHSPSNLLAAVVSSPLGGGGSAPSLAGAGEEDEAAVLKAKMGPGIAHMERCIKTLRATCRWCVCKEWGGVG